MNFINIRESSCCCLIVSRMCVPFDWVNEKIILSVLNFSKKSIFLHLLLQKGF